MLCSILASAAALAAGEFRVGLPLPPWESDPSGTIIPHSAVVSLADNHVTVNMGVTTASEEMPALLLTGPSFGWNSADDYPEKQFPELQIRVDGMPAKLQDRFEAFAGAMNITNMVRMAGLDPWAITHTPPVTGAHTEHPAVLKTLLNLRAIEKSGDDYVAQWTARRIVRVPLPPASEHQVAFEYTARPATAVMTVEELDTTAREKRFCITPKVLKRWSRSGSAAIRLTVTEYELSTAIDGKLPTPVVFSVSPSDAAKPAAGYWFMCGPHGKSVAKNGPFAREPAELDDAGSLRVLKVESSPTS